MIVLGNLADITLFSVAIPGPEGFLEGHPMMVVTVIFVQIVTTLALVNVLASHSAPGTPMASEAGNPRGYIHSRRPHDRSRLARIDETRTRGCL